MTFREQFREAVILLSVIVLASPIVFFIGDWWAL